MEHLPQDATGKGEGEERPREADVTPLRAVPVVPGAGAEPRTVGTAAILAAIGALAATFEAVRRALLAATGRPDEEPPTEEVSTPALLPAFVGASAAVALASGRLAARALDGALRAGISSQVPPIHVAFMEVWLGFHLTPVACRWVEGEAASRDWPSRRL
jgi:hypothetical protein